MPPPHVKVQDDHVMISSGSRTPTKRERGGMQKKAQVWESSSPRSPAPFRLLRAQQSHMQYGSVGSLSPYRDFWPDSRRPFARSKGLGTCLAIFVGLGLAATVGGFYIRALAASSAGEADERQPGGSRLSQELIWADALGRSWLRGKGAVDQRAAPGVDHRFDIRKWAESSLGPSMDAAAQSSRTQWENAHAIFRNHTGGRAELVPLQWDKEMQSFAQSHINTMRRDRRCRLVSAQNDRGYGENLYWSAYEVGPEEDPFTPLSVVEEWFTTGNSYDYKENTCAKKKDCTPYCQLMWDKTRRFGCAAAECPYDGAFEGRQQIFACYYYPAMEKGACSHVAKSQRPF